MDKLAKWAKREFLREVFGITVGALVAYLLCLILGWKVSLLAVLVIAAAACLGSWLCRGVAYAILGPKLDAYVAGRK